MSNWKEQFSEWFDVPRNRSRLIASVIGLFVLFGAVFFSTQIGNLFDLFGSKAGILSADLTKEWQEVVDADGEARAHGKLLYTNDGWLYVVGGMDKRRNLVEDRDEIVMLSTVERIAVDTQTGLIMDDAQWESVVPMNFGHAEFGLVQIEQFIYVIAGDIHVPPEVEGQVPLLYSTIERLDLSADIPAWEVTALLSGVNFYPEVSVKDRKIHVVGGVYGDPFPPFPGMDAEDQRLDILNNGGANFGNLDLQDKPVFGGSGLIYLPVGHENTPIKIGTPVTIQPTPPVVSDTGGEPPAIVMGEIGTTITGSNGSLALISVVNAAQDLPPWGEIIKPSAGDEFYMWDWVNIVWDTEYAGAESLWFQVKGESEDFWRYIGLNTPRYFFVSPPTDDSVYNWRLDPNNRYLNRDTEIRVRVCSERELSPGNFYGKGKTYTNDCYLEALNRFDVSDYFKILPGSRPLVMTITSPVAGDFWQTGEDALISWKIEPSSIHNPKPSAVSIWFHTGVGGWQLISYAQNRLYGDPNGPYFGHEGSFKWRVGQIEDGYIDIAGTLSTAKIRVCASRSANPPCDEPFDISEDFQVRQEYWIENLTTTDPYTEYFDDGRPVTIEWDSHGANAVVKLEYQIDGSSEWTTIARDVPASAGLYYWRTVEIPDIPESVSVRIRASIDASWRIYQYSPHPPTYLPQSVSTYITIKNYDIGQLRALIYEPEESEILGPGSTKEIKWRTMGPLPEEGGKIMQIFYSLDGENSWKFIDTVDIVNEESILWDVPDVHAEFVVIRGTLFNTPEPYNKYVRSGIFSIKGPEMSEMLSDALVSGDFVTTVGEHIVITPGIDTDSAVSGELGNDYISGEALQEQWSTKKVMTLGHLRFMYVQGKIIPALQGRYGHELVEIDSVLTVFGGASWFKEINIGNYAFEYRPKTFWVIDDVTHPFYSLVFPENITKPNYDFGKSLDYQFVGNISLRLGSWTNWSGTNSNGTRNKYSNQLSSDYSFKTDSGTPQGRAFFGFDSYRLDEDTYIAVGGLRNDISSEIPTIFTTTVSDNSDIQVLYVRLAVSPSVDTEKWDGSWVPEQDYRISESEDPVALYNLATAGLDGGVVVYSGQSDFQLEPDGTFDSAQPPRYSNPDPFVDPLINHDPHVPMYPFRLQVEGGGYEDPCDLCQNIGGGGDFGTYVLEAFQFHPTTTMYRDTETDFIPVWTPMPPMPVWLASGFSAHDVIATNLVENPSRVVYQYGGLFSNTLQFLGAFTAGVPDPANITIVPDSGKQNTIIRDMLITGVPDETHMQHGATEIIFTKPSNFNLKHSGDDVVEAGSGILKEITAVFADNEGQPVEGLDVNFNITGSGAFFPPGNSVFTNANGEATIKYRAPDLDETIGLVKIDASTTYAGTPYTSEFWLRLVAPNTPYEIEIFDSSPNPLRLLEDGPVILKMRIYEHVGTERNNITSSYSATDIQWMTTATGDGTPFELLPNNQCFAENNPPDPPDDCLAVEYQPPINESGVDSIIASMTIGQYFVSGSEDVYKNFDLTGSESIIVSNINIDNTEQTAYFDIAIGSMAQVGVWQVLVLSDAVTETGWNYTERLTTTFIVELGDLQSGPRLVDISPGVGEPGVVDLEISILGVETNFDFDGGGNQRTTVTLTSAPNNNNPGIGVIEIPVVDEAGNPLIVVSSSTELVAKLSIPADAKIGYWDVVVTTTLANGAVEEAGYFGHHDFTIVPDSGYILDMIATPNIMPRDGSESVIIGILWQLNTNDGGLIRVPDVDINLHFKDERELGTLSESMVITDENGSFTFTYTIDTELPDVEPLTAIIMADATPEDGVFVLGQTSIAKQNSDYRFDLVADVTQIMITPGQFPNPSRVKLTATLIHPITGEPINEREVIFSMDDVGGTLRPISDDTEFDGIAQVDYYPDQKIGNVTFRARAFVPGLGWIFSESVSISKISSDTERYLLTLSPSDATVETGGSDIVEITATIIDTGNNNDPMGGWPIAFSLVGEHAGDHLTQPVTGVTAPDGTFHINFVPGNQFGNLFVVAEASLLPAESMTIHKVASQEVGYKRISAVPYRVPLGGEVHSIVTVTVKDVNGTPLVGAPVAVATTQAPLEDIYNEAGQSIPQGSILTTDSDGRVVFSVASGWFQPYTTTATATIAGVTISAPISFENNLVRIDNLNIKVPVQARNYDYDDVGDPGIWLAIHENGSQEPYEVDEAYTRSGPPNNYLQGIPSPFYLRADKTYDIWVKGRNHLGSIKQFQTTATSNTIDVTFEDLRAADLGPDSINDLLTPWRDNKVNTIDAQVFFGAWGLDSYLADLAPAFLLRDFKVNTGDFFYWISNYGDGSLKP